MQIFFVILIGVGLWLLLAPFFIFGKIRNLEESLKQKLEKSIHESEKRLRRCIEEGIMQRQEEPQSRSEVLLNPEVLPEVPPVIATEPEYVREEIPAKTAPIKTELIEIRPVEIRPVEPVPIETEPAASVPYEAVAAERQPEEDGKRETWGPPVAEERTEPGIVRLTTQKFLSWLLAEGNIWVCAGVILFFVGFGLLFRYAIQIGLLTLEMRLAAAALTGIAMTAAGFRLRERRRIYALILQGGGMGVLYLTVLGAATLVPLSASLPILPPPFAIFAMLVLSVFTVLLALLQNYQPLAIFAILGGFAAPLLITTDTQNHVALFSIYTLLNLEILAISFKHEWRVLNRMGFIFTVAIGAIWGLNNWNSDLFISVGPFLLTFLATYTVISLNTGREGSPYRHEPDLLLTMSVPFAFLFLQMQVVSHLRYGMALTCLGLGLLHLTLGVFLGKPGKDTCVKEGKGNLQRLHLILCLLFSNLVIPYIFEDRIASAIWAVEGALLIALASRSCSAESSFTPEPCGFTTLKVG